MEPDNFYLCQKCGKAISLYSRLLHDQFCIDYNNLEEVKDNENNNEKINFKYCQKCDVYIDEHEFEDHNICHQLDDQPQMIIDNALPKFQKDFENDCEIIDKSEVVKQMEEEEIFEKKFNTSKENEKSFARKTLEYLITTEHNRAPPIIRFIGTIFDRRQIVAWAVEELGSRIIESGQNVEEMPTEEEMAMLIELLPESEVKDPQELPIDKKECVICLGEFEKEEKVITLPCTHLYHSQCIKDWFKQNNSCPICKFQITKSNMMNSGN